MFVPPLASTVPIPNLPCSLQMLGDSVLKHPSIPIVIRGDVQIQIQKFYGLDRPPECREIRKSEQYLNLLANLSQSMTWEQFCKACPDKRWAHLQYVPADLQPVPLKSLYARVQQPGASKTPWAFLRYRDEYLKLVEAMQDSPSEAERLFAPQEMLAKIIAYADPTIVGKGMIVPIWHEGTVWYQVTEQLHVNGLHAYFLTPTEDVTKPAQLLFRGTKETDSAMRTLDWTGIGKTGFDQCVPKLLDMWKTYVKEHPGASLNVAGHSLGALDAQRMLVALSQEGDTGHAFRGYFFASPKLDADTFTQWKPLANCSLYFAQHAQDLIPSFGDQNLHIPGHTSYYVASSASQRGWLEVHSSPLFPEGRSDSKNSAPELWKSTDDSPEPRSSGIFESKGSFVELKDGAPNILEAWLRWLETQQEIEEVRLGSVPTTPGSILAKLWPWTKA